MKNKIIVCILTIFLLIIAFWGLYREEAAKETFPFEFCVVTDENDITIQLWEDGNNCFYVFVPGYISLEQIEFKKNTFQKIEIDNVALEDGMTCESFQLNVPYSFCYKRYGETVCKELIFLQSSNVATMYIETDSGSMEHIWEEKGNEESGNVMLYTADGRLNYDGRMDSFKGRGNATWSQYAKKPYLIKLEKEADLLDMGSGQKWVLLANSNDSTHMRNKLIYDFAGKVNLPYSPDSQWVDIYLNGEYAGLYLLSEKIEMDENRVAIEDNKESITGSYIVSMELYERVVGTDETYVVTRTGEAFRLNDPNQMNAEQLQVLASQWQSLENAILAEDGVDPVTGMHYLDMIDLDSWARKYLIEEVFANRDGCAISQYFYCINGDFPIYAGPVWDYDGSIGAGGVVLSNGLVANREYFNAAKRTAWFYTLYRKEEFYQRMVEVYEAEFLPELQGLLEVEIPAYKELLTDAVYNNEIRWAGMQAHTFEAEVDFMIDFMNDRQEMLTDIWVDDVEYCHICVDPGYSGKYLYYAVKKGEDLSILTLPEDTPYVHYAGWYDKNTDLPVDINEPVYEDKFLYILGELKTP